VADSACSFCIDNGIMIAHAGLLAHRMGIETPLEKSTTTQRFRTDAPHVTVGRLLCCLRSFLTRSSHQWRA
jgi:tRNA A37 threonylcarbamoyltransferase TsaD